NDFPVHPRRLERVRLLVDGQAVHKEYWQVSDVHPRPLQFRNADLPAAVDVLELRLVADQQQVNKVNQQADEQVAKQKQDAQPAASDIFVAEIQVPVQIFDDAVAEVGQHDRDQRDGGVMQDAKQRLRSPR